MMQSIITNLTRPLQVLAFNMPGFNYIFTISMLYLCSIELVGIILFCRNIFDFMTKVINSGFYRSNILRFSEKTQQKYISKTIKRVLPIFSVFGLVFSLILFNLLDILLPNSVYLNDLTKLLIVIWFILRLHVNYFMSFMIALKLPRFAAFFQQNFSLLVVMIVAFTIGDPSLEILLAFFIMSAFLVLILIFYNLYYIIQENSNDHTKLNEDINLALKNLSFTLTDQLLIYSAYFFILFTIDESMFYIFNLLFAFFNSTGSLKALALNYYLPIINASIIQHSLNKTNELIRNTFKFYLIVCILAILVFYICIDLIFYSKPELIDYSLGLIIYFVSGLIFNSIFIIKNIYSIDNLYLIIKLNIFYAFFSILGQATLYILDLQTMTYISLIMLTSVSICTIHLIYIFINSGLINDKAS